MVLILKRTPEPVMNIPQLKKDESLRNISPEKAMSLMQEELQKNGGKKKSYHFPHLGLHIQADKFDYYVDLGYHDSVNSFSHSLDEAFGMESRQGSFNPDREFYGGLTRMYAFTDSDDKNNLVWTTFFSHYHHDYINIYLRAHEEAHVIQKLNRADKLIDRILEAYPFVNKESLDNDREEFLSTLCSFIPFAEHGISSLLLMLENAELTNIKEFDEVIDLINH